MLPFIPDNIQIEISNRCDLNCFLCPKGRSEVNRKYQDIPLDYFKNIIDEISDNDPHVQLWNYGEPLLHPKIKKIIESIPKVFEICEISTNGQNMSNSLAKSISSSGITTVIFGVDDLDQKTYQKYRKNGSLKKALENIKKLSMVKNKMGYDIEIVVQFIAFKHNFNQIPKLGRFFNHLDVDKIKVKSAVMMFDEDTHDFEKIARNFLFLDYPGERYYVSDGKLKIKGDRLDNCPLMENNIVITSDKKLLPCCWDFKGDYPINTIEEVQEVKSIVNSDNPPEMCLNCPVRYERPFSWNWDEVPGVRY